MRQRRSRRSRPSARSSQETTRGTRPPDRPRGDLGRTAPTRAHPPLPCNEPRRREGRCRPHSQRPVIPLFAPRQRSPGAVRQSFHADAVPRPGAPAAPLLFAPPWSRRGRRHTAASQPQTTTPPTSSPGVGVRARGILCVRDRARRVETAKPVRAQPMSPARRATPNSTRLSAFGSTLYCGRKAPKEKRKIAYGADARKYNYT